MQISEEFHNKIYAVAKRIPAGKVMTYGGLALLAGYPRYARAAGACMRGCKEGAVPCHRVVYHDGSLCSGDAFGGMPGVQRQLLESEGVVFKNGGRVDLKKCLWNGK